VIPKIVNAVDAEAKARRGLSWPRPRPYKFGLHAGASEPMQGLEDCTSLQFVSMLSFSYSTRLAYTHRLQ